MLSHTSLTNVVKHTQEVHDTTSGWVMTGQYVVYCVVCVLPCVHKVKRLDRLTAFFLFMKSRMYTTQPTTSAGLGTLGSEIDPTPMFPVANKATTTKTSANPPATNGAVSSGRLVAPANISFARMSYAWGLDLGQF